MTDPLSSLAHDIIKAAPYDKLVVTGGTPSKAREMLDGVTPDQLLAAPPKANGFAYAMLAGLWLWHDALDECHKIAQADFAPHGIPHGKPSKLPQFGQSMETMENNKRSWEQELAQAKDSLSFWHAIMHRREGDFSNSKYWYARVGAHPALVALANQAGTIVNSSPADKSILRIVANGWSPPAFVDLVEAVEGHPDDPRHRLAVQLQQLEWQTLFNLCAQG